MTKSKTYKAVLHTSESKMSLLVQAKTEVGAKKKVFELLTKEGMPDTYYLAWVRGGRQIVEKEDE